MNEHPFHPSLEGADRPNCLSGVHRRS
jgi:hypothetical protein